MQIAYNCDLQNLHTFGIDSRSRFLISIHTSEDLKQAIQQFGSDVLILGGGSNVVFASDVERPILHIQNRGIHTLESTEAEVIVEIGAGENWHDFVMWAVNQNLGGIENLSLIPGTVGAAPIQNIGAYGVELDQIFDSLDGIHLDTREESTFQKEDCDFGYRDSIFKNELKGKFCITKVRLKLTTKGHRLNTSYGAINQMLESRMISKPTIKDVSEAVISIRQSKLPDPAILGNSGSFFKNPVIDIGHFHDLKNAFPNIVSYPVDDTQIKVPAGWLIEQCGFKGKRFGNVGCYEKQALVLINHGNATGNELLDLAKSIIQSVKMKFGIELSREVNVIT